jgi:hypothetical protein
MQAILRFILPSLMILNAMFLLFIMINMQLFFNSLKHFLYFLKFDDQYLLYNKKTLFYNWAYYNNIFLIYPFLRQ